MKTKILTNKDGLELKTKEGVTLVEHKLEAGDVILLQSNKLFLQKNSEYETYKCLALVKNFAEEEPVFITLTPTQAKQLFKILNQDEKALEKQYIAYEYQKEDKTYIGIASNIPIIRKTFKDFE